VSDKRAGSAQTAVQDIPDGASIAVGGFGSCGIPSTLIDALIGSGSTDLTIVSNNCGIDGWGLGRLLEAGRIKRLIASYVGENAEFVRQYLGGDLEVELTPQGTLAERLRAGGAGIPAFYTPAGLGTMVAEGGLPWRYGATGEVVTESEPRPIAEFDGQSYVLERGIRTDFALVHAWKADPQGNAAFRMSARNFNPACAMAGAITILEAEDVVELGDIPPDGVHLPGIFVQTVIEVPVDFEKRIDRITTQLVGSTR
jgi:3-oxoacid CoA-transferase subunit A